jgi:hypothetical protein
MQLSKKNTCEFFYCVKIISLFFGKNKFCYAGSVLKEPLCQSFLK